MAPARSPDLREPVGGELVAVHRGKADQGEGHERAGRPGQPRRGAAGQRDEHGDPAQQEGHGEQAGGRGHPLPRQVLAPERHPGGVVVGGVLQRELDGLEQAAGHEDGGGGPAQAAA